MSRITAIAFCMLCTAGFKDVHAQTCTAASAPVAFGNYQPLQTIAVTTTGTVTITCNPGALSIAVSYTITLGVGGGGSFAARSMSGTGPRLVYQLYRDNGYSQVWGDGTAGTYTVVDGYLLGVVLPITRNYTVYGMIPGNKPAGTGSYNDSVLVTVTY